MIKATVFSSSFFFFSLCDTFYILLISCSSYLVLFLRYRIEQNGMDWNGMELNGIFVCVYPYNTIDYTKYVRKWSYLTYNSIFIENSMWANGNMQICADCYGRQCVSALQFKYNAKIRISVNWAMYTDMPEKNSIPTTQRSQAKPNQTKPTIQTTVTIFHLNLFCLCQTIPLYAVPHNAPHTCDSNLA